MENTKLMQLLYSFSPQEIQRFQLYLKSPFFNTDEIIFQLFEAIRPYLHSRNKAIPDSKTIWQNMSSKARFNNLQFNKHCSYLYQYASDFIALHQLKTKTNAFSLQYLHVLNQRRLTDLFSFHAERLKPSLQKHSENPDLDFVEQFQYQQQINSHQEIMQSRQHQLNTAEVLNALEEFYLYEKLKYWSAAKHYNNLFDQSVNIRWEEFLTKWITQNSAENKLIEIYRHIFLLQTAVQAEPHYQWLKAYLNQPKSGINKATQKEIYLFSINYCIAQINSGNTLFYKEIFQLYQLALKQELLIHKKSMSPWDFKNIVTVALQQKEINWTEKFIKTYSTYLPKEETKNAYNYNLAKVFFMQKKYSESLKLLQQVAYTDLFYQLDIKVMQAKTLYELKEMETLDDLIVSFKKILERKRRLSKHYQTIYRKFLMYLQRMLKIHTPEMAAIIAAKLDADGQVPDKSWLREKLLRIGS